MSYDPFDHQTKDGESREENPGPSPDTAVGHRRDENRDGHKGQEEDGREEERFHFLIQEVFR